MREIRDDAVRMKAMAERDAINQKFPQVRATVQDLVDHIDHVRKVVGIDYVGIGTDFDGGGGVVGCDDVSGMIHVTEELIRRGYTDREIEKDLGRQLLPGLREGHRPRGKIDPAASRRTCKASLRARAVLLL